MLLINFKDMTEVESLELDPLLPHKARPRSGTLDVEAPDILWEGRPRSQRFFFADWCRNHRRALKSQLVRYDQIIKRFIAHHRRNFWIFIGLLVILVLVISRTALSVRTTRSWTMADYPRLPDPSSNIRLLQIKKGFRNRISYTMESVPLAANPKYDALSYNWGDVRKKETISVNGKTMSITQNLNRALKAITSSGESRTLWIDQICIDQNNLEEKARQIPLMNSIYSRAENVLVWLGAHKPPRWVENSKSLDWAGGWGVAHATLYPHAALYWLYLLSEEEYWKRCWIIQEVGLASNIQIHFGSVPIPWKEFIKLMKWYEANYAKANIKNILQLHGLRHLIHEDREKFSLAYLLAEFRDSFCSVSHDKIYSLFGMADECADASCVEVDYNSSRYSLYSEVLRLPNNVLQDPVDWRIGLPYLSGVIRHVLTKEYEYVPETLDYFGTIADPNSYLYEACGDEREIACLKDPSGKMTSNAEAADRGAAWLRWILSFFTSSTSTGQTVWLPSKPENPTMWLPNMDVEDDEREVLIRGMVTGEVSRIGPLYSEVLVDGDVGRIWLLETSLQYGSSLRQKSRTIISRFMSLIGMPDFVTHVTPFGDAETYLHPGIRLFLGSNIMVGMLPGNARVGDLVCQFWNSQSAAILRPKGEADYEIVGKALVMRQINSFAWDVPTNKTAFQSLSSGNVDLPMGIDTLTWLTLDSISF